MPATVEVPIGIDLGTTYSTIAYLDPNSGRPVSIDNGEGRFTTPSVVFLDDQDVIVGDEAVAAIMTDSDRVAVCAKRDMGKRTYYRQIDGRQYPPEVIQAFVLQKLKLDAQRVLGNIHRAVITVPAYFDETRRVATQASGYMAGIEVLDIINEPTAAALAYGMHKGFLNAQGKAEQTERLLIYDLGGGTFDVSVVEVNGNEFRTLATDGDVRLGGQDWDRRLIDLVAQEFLSRHQIDPRSDFKSLSKLWLACEAAKRTLSVRTDVSIPCEFQGIAERIRISRDQFEEASLDLVDRTATTTRQVLREGGMSWDSIQHLLLVGGSTRMPMIKRMLAELSGKQPDDSVSVNESVAHGAAMHAGLILDKSEGKPPKFHLRDVNSHSLGIVGTNPKTKEQRNAIMIPRNTELPKATKRLFHTQHENQKSIHIQILEGECPVPDGCIKIGTCVVRNLPAGLKAGTPIEVIFRLAENGTLGIDVRVQGTNTHLHHELQHSTALTKDQLDAWKGYISARS